MDITTTNINIVIKGEIVDGPTIPLAQYQKQGEGRRIVGFEARINASEKVSVSLISRRVKKDGSLYDTGADRISSWSLKGLDPVAGQTMKKVEELLNTFLPWENFVEKRPQLLGASVEPT